MRRTLRKACSSLMPCSIERQDKSMTIYSINQYGDHPAFVFANAQSKPRHLLAGFCLARKLCFLDGLKKNVSTRLLSFRYGFDCGWQPAFSSASCGSRGEPRFYARRSFFHAEPPGQRLHPSRRLLPSRLRPLPKHSACWTTTPQRTESIRPSQRRVNGKNISPYTDHTAARHTARFALSFSLAERIWPRMASHSASPSFESAEKFPVPPRCPAPSMAIVWPVR